jgi:mono/diheme cytochrome c family protein
VSLSRASMTAPEYSGERSAKEGGARAYPFPAIMTFCFRFRSSFTATLIFYVSCALVGAVRAAEPFDAFLKTHCIRCHGPEKEKGDLRIDQLSRDFKLGADTHHWAEVIEQVNSGEMPPKKEKNRRRRRSRRL